MRLIVYYRIGDNGGYINIPCDRMECENGFLLAWNRDELTGAFDLGRVDMAYLSEAGKCLR